MDLIIYHNACPDGFTAAYVAKKRYPEAELLPLDHGLNAETTDAIYERVTGKNVIVVDYSFRTRGLNDMMDNGAKSGGGSFLILDHHKTAQAALDGASYATFDMNRSGAGLAWDYLFGKDSKLALPLFVDGVSTGEYLEAEILSRPWWVDYVEDRDLWRHALPNSKEVNAYIGTLPMTVEAWDGLSKFSATEAANLGIGALAHIDHYVREAVKQAKAGTLNVKDKLYSTLVVNVPYLNVSEIGNVLARSADVGIGWFERGDGMVQFSLRSIGDTDVSEIAKTFNGGGHKNAAGFQVNLAQGRNIVDTILSRVS